MQKISDRKLKKAEEDITRIINDLFKQQRGLNWLEPSIQINFFKADTKLESNLFDKLEGENRNSGTTVWKWIGSKSSKLTIILFKK